MQVARCVWMASLQEQPFRFLDLPAELRTMVYTCLLPQQGRLARCPCGEDHATWESSSTWTAMLTVNHSVSGEALAAFYDTTTFEVSFALDGSYVFLGDVLHCMCRPLEPRDVSVLSKVRHLGINIDSQAFSYDMATVMIQQARLYDVVKQLRASTRLKTLTLSLAFHYENDEQSLLSGDVDPDWDDVEWDMVCESLAAVLQPLLGLRNVALKYMPVRVIEWDTDELKEMPDSTGTPFQQTLKYFERVVRSSQPARDLFSFTDLQRAFRVWYVHIKSGLVEDDEDMMKEAYLMSVFAVSGDLGRWLQEWTTCMLYCRSATNRWTGAAHTRAERVANREAAKSWSEKVDTLLEAVQALIPPAEVNTAHFGVPIFRKFWREHEKDPKRLSHLASHPDPRSLDNTPMDSTATN